MLVFEWFLSGACDGFGGIWRMISPFVKKMSLRCLASGQILETF